MTSSLPSPPFPDPSLKAHSPLNAQNVLLLALEGASPRPGVCSHPSWRHSPISPAPVQVATPLLGSPAQGEEMTLVPRPSWLCQSPHPAPAIPHLSTEAVALILVNKPRDRAQGSWLGLASVVESDDGSAGAGWPAWRKGPFLLILGGAISSFCSSSRRVCIDQWREPAWTLKSKAGEHRGRCRKTISGACGVAGGGSPLDADVLQNHRGQAHRREHTSSWQWI